MTDALTWAVGVLAAFTLAMFAIVISSLQSYRAGLRDLEKAMTELERRQVERDERIYQRLIALEK